ncbi:cytochrome b/b6 domain-containing protein [Roseomonas rosulenta]|uniref:cytochrome b/b6 domain-containing protein n=1 Tax=Roseomonas rosulenta TaxID=2748667 RepID=UPI0018DF380C|nr:cytochrome b/b6 domain-containing protein [Roseomonas rosulenta]
MSEKTVPVKVWDGWVRLFHWGTAGCVLVSYFSAKSGAWNLHYGSGYLLLTLVGFRILWGLLGSENARFWAFLRGPVAALRQLASFRRPGPDTETTHNPAGAWMVVLLLALLAAQGVSGLMANHDVGFTYSQHGPLANWVSEATSERMTNLHATLVNLLLLAVLVHVLAVVSYRLFKGQDLVVPMVTGVKEIPASHAKPPRLAHPALGVVLLAVAAFGVWFVRRLGMGA